MTFNFWRKPIKDRLAAACLFAVCIQIMTGGPLAGAQSFEDAKQTETYNLNDFYFDTVVSIRFDTDQDGEALLQGCRDICTRLEQTFSRTDENSELYAVNHRESDHVEVSEPLARLTQTGLDYYEISEGRFDITVSPLSDLWDFKSETPSVPPEAEIQNALRKVDGSAVHVVSEENKTGETVWYLDFDREDTMIDLGALVKGYAADVLSAYLKEEGVLSGLINLGGNVYAIGTKEGGSAWKIGIQKPFDTDIIDAVEVQDQSVVTSGVYERCFESDGVLYHHILDPETGYPVQNNLWSVSIISDSSLTGDALSTVCMLLGQDAAMDLIRHTDGARAIFVDNSLHKTECE